MDINKYFYLSKFLLGNQSLPNVYKQGHPLGGANSSIELGFPNFKAQTIFLFV